MRPVSHKTACHKCLGSGVTHIRPSKRDLHEYRQAAAAAAQDDAAPPPARPAQRRVPCAACSGVGLLDGEAPVRALGSDDAPLVAIVGGGIGGTALALALQQRGVAARVYERDASFEARAQGYGLTMQQGATALARLGVPNEGVFSAAHHSFLPDGKLIGSYGRSVHENTRELGGNGRGDDQRRNAHIPRQALRENLLCRLAEGTVQWGRRLESYEEGEDGGSRAGGGVVLKFADGGSARAAVLVGADGIWSRVRAQRLRGADAPPRYMGVVVVLGRAPCEHPLAAEQVFQTLDGETRIYTMPFTLSSSSSHGADGVGGINGEGGDDGEGADGGGGGGGVSTGGVTMWQLSYRLTEAEAVAMARDGASLKAEALRRCGGWHEPIPQLLRDTRPEDITGYPAYDREPLRVLGPHGGGDAAGDEGGGEEEGGAPSVHAAEAGGGSTAAAAAWLVGGSSRVTLLGDAAHPMSPFKGQGANQALLDAVELARALRGSDLCGGGAGAGGTAGTAGAAGTPLAEALGRYEAEMMRRATPKVLKSRDAAEQLHCAAATQECNSTRAAAARRANAASQVHADTPESRM